ncbi:MAG: saccharopine dehydrogenase family protein [Armatimonadota bacterium]
MRIIALGGAGDMGSRAVRDLARQPDLEALVIGDYNETAAQALAEDIRDERVSARKVDATDHEGLVAALASFDVAASAVGPFYRFERMCAAAAVEAGCHYVSLCDDYDATQAVLELDGEATGRGVTILTGLGWTPGISNVLARRAAEQLDEVRAIEVAWGSSASDSEGFAVILHTLHIFSGTVPSWQGGRLVEVAAGSGRQRVRFPEPLGECTVFHLGHPEPVTLPLTYESVETVTLKGGLSEDMLNWLAKLMASLRLSNTHGKRVAVAKLLKALLPVIGRIGRPAHPCSGIRVDVKGMRDGETTTITYGAADNMERLTGLPLAIGAAMIGRGEITQRGVMAPEACIPPDTFIAELAKRSITVYEGDLLEAPLAAET